MNTHPVKMQKGCAGKMKSFLCQWTLILLPLSAFTITTTGFSIGKSDAHHDRVSVYALKYIYGRYEMPVTNDGRFGYDPAYNVPGGTRWPQGTKCGYLFGAGIWIGSLIDSVKTVTLGYNPTNVQTEMVPGAPPNEPGYSDPSKTVYISSDYPNPSLPPWPFGYNSDGTPKSVSQMDSWSQSNDLDTTHQFAGGLPLGVLVTTETYSWNSSYRDVQDIVFFRYTIKNIRPDHKTWENAYIGIAMDADIGDPTNDLCGAFPDLNLGFEYSPEQLSAYEKTLPYPPGLVGVQFIDGPVKDPVTGIAKLHSYVRWASELTPNNDEQWYDLLAAGEMDTVDSEPGDKRMLLSNGPFTLAYGDSVQFIMAVCFAEPDWYFNSSLKGTASIYPNKLKEVAANAIYIYDHNFLFPQPPSLPRLTLLPEDQKMVITWDASSEKSVEPVTALPTTDPHNFEGYRLYKSTSGTQGTFQLLGDWDLVDFDDLGKPIGTNTGLVHSYIDQGLTDGKNMFYALTAYAKGEYQPGHYGDSAYEVVAPLETGMIFGVNLNAAVPQPPASNFTSPGLSNYSVTSNDSASMRLTVTSQYLVTDSVKSGQYKLEFGSPGDIRIDLGTNVEGPNIYVVDVSTGDTVSTTMNFPITDPPTSVSSDFFNGMELSFTGPILSGNTVDTAYFTAPRPQVLFVKPTDFSGDYYTAQSAIIRQTPLSCFFLPHKYLIYFVTPQVVNVYDLTTNQQLKFTLRTLGQDYAIANYVGTPTVNATTGDTTWTWSNSPAGFKRYPDPSANAFKFYLPGGFLFIQDVYHTIQAGDSLIISFSGYSAPRTGDIITFNIAGSKVNYHSDLSVIKVVPNPYLVRAPWDLDNDYQKIEFINLPTQCTIKIYTVAGDLVQTIQHSEPFTSGFTSQSSGTAYWNLMTRNNQKVSTGVYVYYVSSPFGSTIGRFAIVR